MSKCVCDPLDAYVRVSQIAVDVVKKPTDSNMRMSQIVLEVLKLPDPSGAIRVSQLVIELPKSGTVTPTGLGSQLYEA